MGIAFTETWLKPLCSRQLKFFNRYYVFHRDGNGPLSNAEHRLPSMDSAITEGHTFIVATVDGFFFSIIHHSSSISIYKDQYYCALIFFECLYPNSKQKIKIFIEFCGRFLLGATKFHACIFCRNIQYNYKTSPFILFFLDLKLFDVR